MRVLVTGGGGYIGSVLCRILLESGYDVTCLDRFFFGRNAIEEIADKMTVIKGDIRYVEPETLKGVDAVFDLASLSNDPSGELEPRKTLEINFEGRVRMAQLSKKQEVPRYVLASTCSVYGFQEGIITERSSLNPLTTYAKANVMAEKEILPLANKSFTVTALRQATVYGLSPRMRFDLAINGMTFGFFKNGKIPIMRDGKQWRPFVHVKDTCRAFMKVLESDPRLVNGQVFNVSSNEHNVQIFDLARLVAAANDLPFNYEWYGSPDNRSYRVDFSKIKDTLDFEPQYTIEAGAKEVFNALKKGIINPDDPKMITVKWYRHLLDMQIFLHDVEIDGAIL